MHRKITRGWGKAAGVSFSSLTRICPKRQVARRPDTPRLTAYHGQRQAPRRVSAFTLAQLELGARARVTAVAGAGALALRLLEMGFVPGAVVTLVKRAPFGDPLELQVRGCHISLRRAEAARIEAVPT